MSIGDDQRREDRVGCRGVPDRARERKVGATHVVEVDWKICLGRRLFIGPGADFDHHLEWAVQSVDQVDGIGDEQDPAQRERHVQDPEVEGASERRAQHRDVVSFVEE